MKLLWCSAAAAVVVGLNGCSVLTSDSWRERADWRYEPPRTGSNVGRWIAVGEPSKPKRAKSQKSQKAKQQPPRDTTPAPPADRFR